jgi:hypothetical protein
MTPIVTKTSILSRLSVGWLEDAGYQVDYNQADAFTSANLGANCVCNTPTRSLVRHLGPMELSETLTSASNADGVPRRRLSTEGYNAAMAYGLAHLNDKHDSHGESVSSAKGSNDGGIQYVGDQAISVIYVEEGTLHCILVRRGN